MTVASDTTTTQSSRTFEVSDEDATMIELEDQLPELGNDDIDHVQKTDSFWLMIDDKPVHKASAVRYLLYSEEGRKSTDRPSRAAGMKKIRSFSWCPNSPLLNDDSLIGDKFLLNQLVVTFIRTKNVVTLAIIRVSSINDETGASVAVINTTALLSQEVTLCGQVLTLQKWDSATWIWDKSFESFSPDNKPAAVGHIPSKKTSVIDIPTCITQTIKAQYEQKSDSVGLIFKFDTAELESVADILWDKVKTPCCLNSSKEPNSNIPL
jgi:hypothetical protein